MGYFLSRFFQLPVEQLATYLHFLDVTFKGQMPAMLLLLFLLKN